MNSNKQLNNFIQNNMGPYVSQAAQVILRAANQFVQSAGFKYLVVTNAKKGYKVLKNALDTQKNKSHY